MLLKTVIVLLSFVGFKLVEAASNDGDCHIEGLENWPIAVSILPQTGVLYDNDFDTTLFEGGYQGVLDINYCSCAECGHNYISFDKNDTHFVIQTTEELKNYDTDVIKNPPKTLGVFIYLCNFTCNTEKFSDLNFQITLKDNNDYSPEFSTGQREYTVPFPIMPKVDFSIYGDLIQASDKDFGNKYINFSVTPDDFDVTVTNDNSVPPLFTAHFQAKNVIMYEDNPITYTITATDSGDHPGPLNSTIKITLSKNNENSVDTPSFEKQSYSFQYENNNTLTPLDGAITVSTEKPSNIDDLDLVGTLSDSFNCELTSTFEIGCSVIKNVEDPSVDFVILTLSVKTDTVASTSLIIYFSSGSSILKPSFSEHFYTGTYVDTSNTVKLDTPIEVSNPSKDSLDVNITGGDFYDQFSIQPSADNKSYWIKVEKALSVDDIKQYNFISLTLEVTNDKGSDNAVVNINLPDYDLAFTSVLYTGSYTDDDEVVLDETNPIAFTKSGGKVVITVDDDYSDYFNVTENYLIEVRKKLPDSIKASNTEIAMTLTATDDYKNTQQAVLKLTLPLSNNLTAPEFQNLFYKVIYKQGATGSIDFEENIEFKNVEDVSKVTIGLSENSENFEIKYVTDKWIFNIKKSLDDDYFKNNKDIVIIMEATEDNLPTGYGVLIVELDSDSNNDKSPQFKELSYIVQYQKDQTTDIEFINPLSFKNVDDMTKLNISLSDYSENFNVVYNNNKWSIQVVEKLDPSVFDEQSELVTTMIAKLEGVEETGKGVLVIELIKNSPSQDAPEFKDPYYLVTYKKGDTGFLDFDKPLTIKNENDATKIHINLDAKYADNFAIVYNDEKWRFNITKAIDDTEFDKNSKYISTITVTVDDVEGSGVSALFIELEGDSSPDNAPEFSDPFYLVQYTKGDTEYLDFDKPLTFKNEDDATKLTISLGEYAENFNVTYKENKWQLQIIQPLDDSIFDTKTDLVIIMEAKLTGSNQVGSGVLVIELIDDKVENKEPKFEKAYYSATYPESGEGTIEFDSDINFENVDDMSKVKITDVEYSTYFNVSYNENTKKWEIIIKTPLKDTLLESKYLASTLSATVEDSDEKSLAAFILNLPEIDEPVFNSSYYKASYVINETTATIEFDDFIGFTNKDDMSNINITADEYPKNFIFKYDGKNWQASSTDILNVNQLNRTDLVVSITAEDKSNQLLGHSIIDLKLPSINTDGAPKFSKTYYIAHYQISGEKSTVTLDDDFSFSNKDDMSKIKIRTDEYNDYFNITHTGTNWVINVVKNLDSSILSAKVDIVMSLIAIENSNSEEIGQCALVITLPVVNNEDAPKFYNFVYQTVYDSTNTTLDTQLRIVNKEDLSKVTITILETEYQSNFDITYDKTNEFWSVTVLSLPESVNEDTTDLIITLVANEDQNDSTGFSALIINFPILVAPTFSKNQYYGSYAQSTADLEVEYITITNKEDLSDISLRFEDDDFSDNFNLTLNDDTKNWNVTLFKPLTDDQINNKNELVLTLTATEIDNSKVGIATVIIRLSEHTDNNDSLDFDNIYYTGSYQADGEKGVVTLDNNIKITTTEDVTKVEANITDVDYTEYFELRPNSNYYEVIVKKILPPTILSREVLVMSLKATLDDLTAFATLVIYLPTQANEKFVQFENGIYNGNYTIPKDGNDIFKFDTIRIVTNGDVANIQVSITEDSIYRAYFNVTNDALDVNLTIGDLPAEIYKTIKVLPLKLSATLTDSTYIGYAIINIQIIYEESVDYGYITFTSPIYNGRYDINEDTAVITYDPISIDTDQDDSNIEVKAIHGSDSFVEVTYANKQVYLTLQSTDADNIIRNLSNKAVVLQADLKSSSESTTTVVNFKVVDNDNGGADNNEIKFNQLIYRGECDLDKKNKRINFNVEEMTLDTDRQDSEINVTIQNDNQFDQYFQVSYSQSEVHLHLGFLPEYIFKTKAYIILTLSAEVRNLTSIYAEAVVVIKLNYINGGISSDEKTSYIIAISILAAFIMLILAAAAAFYYFRLRHLKYKSMTDEEYKGVKFDQTAIQHSEAKKKTSSAVDQRRPTGFIFKKPIEQSNEETESTTDGAEGRERRKSVLFDDNVEKLQIETVVDDDIDKASEETENAD